MDLVEFYDALAADYHLIYEDWESSIERHGEALDRVFRSVTPAPVQTVLDAACGIGTQSLGLARRGYGVTGSDLSPAAVERARREARRRGLSIEFSVADMRELSHRHGPMFDAIIACDNALPHLLSDEEILQALDQFARCIRPGGICVASLRDYASEARGAMKVVPHGVRRVGSTRYVPLQVWEWEGDLYRLTLYVVEHAEHEPPRTRAVQTTCYAVSIARAIDLMRQAGFSDVRRLDDVFFQPLVIGRRPIE